MKSNNGKDNVTYQRLNIFENNKIVLFTVPKIAHSWCNTRFLKEEPGKLKTDSEFSINQITFDLESKFHKGEPRDDDYFKKIEKTWNSITDKKEKRDLVILYRNPYEHFLSAFMQDYSKNFFPHDNNQQAYWQFFIESLQVPSVIKSQFFNDVELQRDFNSEIVLKYPEIASQIITINFDFYLKKGNLESGHYRTWLSFVNRLLTSNKIDSNKVRFVDIYDAPLETQLKSVIEIDEGPSYQNSTHSWSFNILDNLIKNNVRYYDIISSFLKYEMLYYEEIKTKYKKNHLYNPFQ